MGHASEKISAEHYSGTAPTNRQSQIRGTFDRISGLLRSALDDKVFPGCTCYLTQGNSIFF
ncbi:MAG: hypothetical protein KDD60_10170, partial [Bdellovibrionales bacterium]|nr:hypothetical protein [Bdellovibrionales bacterium]